MGKKNDLSYYMQLNYDVILRNQGNLYYLFIPELCIIVGSEHLSHAYENLEKEKKQFFLNMINANAEDVINEPQSKVIKKSFLSELPIFCIKTLLVFFVCTSLLGIIFIGTLPLANSIISGIPIKMTALTYAFATKVNTKLTSLTDEEEQEIKLKYRRMLYEIKYLIDDVKTVFGEKNDNKIDHIDPPEKGN